MSLRSVRILTRFFNSSRPQVPRFRYSPFLILRSNSVLNNNLLPTTRISRFHASIPRCCSSVCGDSRSESTHTENSALYSALDSVVEVFCFYSEPNVVKPWKNQWEGEAAGSGFVISGRRILTNAHVVEYHSYVQVKKHGSFKKYKAIVEAVGDECDLAILVVDNEEFWEDLNPLELGDIPFMGDTVFVLGYPCGGDTISVTEGIISRVEFTDYCHSYTDLLTIQIDATVTGGNSGGPVIMGNKVVGVAFQGLPSQNIEEIIPTPVIKHFLSVVEKTGYYIGFDLPDISCQAMENSQIRRHFKMNHGMSGILINEINLVSAAHKILKKDDVILAIDGVPIGNDETCNIVFRGKERIHFNHLVSMKKPGERGLFKVLRDGRKHEFKISLDPVKQRLVPVLQFDPSCYIFAGFVFVVLSKANIDDSYGDICDCALKKKPKKASEDIIIISQVLWDDINVGYSSFENLQVKKVNGVEVLNLSHLRKLIKKCRTEDLRLDLENEKVIVLNYKSAREATSLILKRLRIPYAMSEDL